MNDEKGMETSWGRAVGPMDDRLRKAMMRMISEGVMGEEIAVDVEELDADGPADSFQITFELFGIGEEIKSIHIALKDDGTFHWYE